jgi:hypothetical protein
MALLIPQERIEGESMREITPYTTKRGLQKTLDNGGRFYNFFTDADDNVVSRAELAKAAGVGCDRHAAGLSDAGCVI